MDKYFLREDDAVLVIVDMQEKLAAVMSERKRIIENCLRLIEAAKLLHIPIILNEQYPRGLGRTVGEIRDALPDIEPIEKIAFSCCGQAAFLDRLSVLKRNKIVLCGMETHVCVLQSCLDLIKSGYAVHVVSDAVCSRTKANFKTGIELMRDAGSVITCTETVLFQILGRADRGEFRIISKLIK